MSCPSSQNSRNFNVTAGSLPEGYCPITWQDFLADLAARLIVTSPLNNSSFATGATMPSSNVGPWLKDCSQWFFFDDATGLYKIQTKGGFDSQQYFSAGGSFTVPDNIYKIRIHLWGGGGGGYNNSTTSAGAGGGGAYGCSIVSVTPGQVIPIAIGAGGGGGAPGADGGDTIVLGLTAGGGKKGTSGFLSGLGGTASGFDVNFSGGAGMGNPGGESFVGCSGGDAGGGGGKGGAICDGAATTGRNGTAPGGGGAGGIGTATVTPGNGADGGCLIEY